ncbi:hypothetical protein Bhyg_10550 [Pseudolycoriella hygida]|uniref:Uncharacterized protein n=1 Tax=Pseudolycoriella hygida TaxID=35572 RepID=A0A9Q0RZE9_9DIPT|nr:hypothetical protein Bhyg_10550 [Pseudolycoriella hygida]
MILNLYVFVVLATFSSVRGEESVTTTPILSDNQAINSRINDKINELTALVEELENNEEQRRERLRTTGI